MCQEDVLIRRDLPSPGVHRTSRHRERDRTPRARPRKVSLGVIPKPRLHQVRRVGGTQQPDRALQESRQWVDVVDILVRRRRADRLCHDFCPAEKDATVAPLRPHVLQVRVAHILHGKDPGVAVRVQRLADRAVEVLLALPALLVRLCQ